MKSQIIVSATRSLAYLEALSAYSLFSAIIINACKVYPVMAALLQTTSRIFGSSTVNLFPSVYCLPLASSSYYFFSSSFFFLDLVLAPPSPPKKSSKIESPSFYSLSLSWLSKPNASKPPPSFLFPRPNFPPPPYLG